MSQIISFRSLSMVLLAMMAFYWIVSLWFHFRRYQFVRRADQFTMNWPKPQGY